MSNHQFPFTVKLVESLYVEAMVLADEARSYFELTPEDQGLTRHDDIRIDMSCESLRVTTRLMHSIAWLLNQKAYFAGELSLHQLHSRSRSLGKCTLSDPFVVARLPQEAQRLVQETQHLLDRLVRLEKSLEAERLGFVEEAALRPAVLQMQARLASELA
jgi:regulator of CtrA degradation